MAAPRLRVGFILLDEFTLTAFSGLIDAVRLAADHGGRSRKINASWTVMSVGGKPRRSSCGVVISELRDLSEPSSFDYIAVCGGNGYLSTEPNIELGRFLTEAVAASARLLGVCTGTFAIAQSALVGDRKVCVHWNVLDAFRAQFPDIAVSTDQIFIDEGDLITCAGSTAAIDLGLHLIARHCGRDKAKQVVRHMMLNDARSPAAPQAHFYASLDGIKDVRVRQAAHFMEQRLDAPPRIEAVSRYVGIGPRQLERCFHKALGKSPTSFQRQLRLDYGGWLLRNSAIPIAQIALDCGFSDAAHFARDFRTHSGMTPREFRGSA